MVSEILGSGFIDLFDLDLIEFQLIVLVNLGMQLINSEHEQELCHK